MLGSLDHAFHQLPSYAFSPVQLFNMEADPTEQKNVASENPAIVKRLDTLMQEAWRAP